MGVLGVVVRLSVVCEPVGVDAVRVPLVGALISPAADIVVLRAGSNKAVPNISSGAIFRVAPGLSALSLRSSSASSSAATRSVLVSKRQPARAACLTASVFSSVCRRPLTASTVVATAQRRARHRA